MGDIDLESELRKTHMVVTALLAVTTSLLETLEPTLGEPRRKSLVDLLESRRLDARNLYRRTPYGGSLKVFEDTMDIFKKHLDPDSG